MENKSGKGDDGILELEPSSTFSQEGPWEDKRDPTRGTSLYHARSARKKSLQPTLLTTQATYESNHQNPKRRTLP